MNNKVNHSKILKLHEQKINEISNKDKTIKQLLSKKEKLETDLVNVKNDYLIINNIKVEIDKINKQMEYISSGDFELDYMFNSMKHVQMYISEKEKLKDPNQSQEDIMNIQKSMEDIYSNYMYSIDPNYTRTHTYTNKIKSICKYCNNNDFIAKDTNGFYVCENCGYEMKGIVNVSNLLSYKQMQELDFKSDYTYLKQSHLSELLKRFQAKERKHIPAEVIQGVISEAKKERIIDLNTLTDVKVRYYLKKLGYNIYYDNIVTIINRINNRPPLKLSVEIEEKIKMMFQQIQEPFEKYKDKNRKNMLSYTYLLRKFFEILGLNEFAIYFPLLKTQEKLRQQDEIFKKIVEEVAKKDSTTGWVFHASI